MDTPVTVPVLANDSDPDGDVLTVTSVGTPANGTATLNGSSVTYTPNPGFTGSDSFPYTISDGHGNSATATVTITVTPDSESSADREQRCCDSTAMDTPVTVPVLANDSDPDGDVLTVTSVGTPANGTATLNGNSVTYTPSPVHRQRRFPVHDQRRPRPQRRRRPSRSRSHPIPNRPPIANNDAASTAMDTPVTFRCWPTTAIPMATC